MKEELGKFEHTNPLNSRFDKFFVNFANCLLNFLYSRIGKYFFFYSNSMFPRLFSISNVKEKNLRC